MIFLPESLGGRDQGPESLLLARTGRSRDRKGPEIAAALGLCPADRWIGLLAAPLADKEEVDAMPLRTLVSLGEHGPL